MASENPKDKEARTAGRIDFSTVPPIANTYLAMAMMEGAKKYGRYNWRDHAIDLITYTAAAERHLTALKDGEWIDRDSGIPHAAKIMACMTIILDAMNNGTLIVDRQDHSNLKTADLIWEQGNKK